MRLEEVSRRLEIAAGEPADRVRAAHALRVATRRAGAALAFFRPCLKQKPRKKVARALREIRASAAHARRCDVLHAYFLDRAGTALGPEREACEAIALWTAGRREAATAEIYHAAESIPRKRLMRRCRRLVKSLRLTDEDRSRRTFAEFAQHIVADLTGAFHAAADADLTDVEHLHELRIAGKRLRYGLEIARRCMPREEYRRRMFLLRSLQDRLGALNDHADAAAWIDEFLAQTASDGNGTVSLRRVLCEGLRDRLDKDRLDRTAAFFADWQAGYWSELMWAPQAGNATPVATDG